MNNIKLTDNLDLRMLIIEKLKANNGYCPCKIDKTPETKCICKEFHDMPSGSTCHCGLYQKD